MRRCANAPWLCHLAAAFCALVLLISAGSAQVPKTAPAKVPTPMPAGAKAQAPVPPGMKGPILPVPGAIPAKPPPAQPANTPLAKKDKDKKEKLPAPEDVTLETSDGVSIRATWYLGLKKKEAVPIIIVHGWEGSRGQFDGLAKFLQTLGHCVIVPDLRGHGDSKLQKLASGESRTIDPASLRSRELESMLLDLEACKQFLIEKNNAGECNIEMLCVIGAEFGSILAIRYAAMDWSVPDLPAYKQGRDVKALVLLTPYQSQRTLTMREALAHPAVQRFLSVMIVAGKSDAKGFSDAKRIFNSLQAHHPRPPSDPQEQARRQDLFLIQPETSLAGAKLLGSGVRSENGLLIREEIALRIIKWRLENRKAEFPWSERRSPGN